MSEVGISAFVFFRMMMYANLFVMFDSNIASLGFKAFQKLFDFAPKRPRLDPFAVLASLKLTVGFKKMF